VIRIGTPLCPQIGFEGGYGTPTDKMKLKSKI